MKTKTLLLALAGLIGLIGNAKATIVFSSLDITYDKSSFLSFAFDAGTSQINVSSTSNLDGGFSLSYTPARPNPYYGYFGPATLPASYEVNCGHASDWSTQQFFYGAALSGDAVDTGGANDKRMGLSDLALGETRYLTLGHQLTVAGNPTYSGWAAFTGTGSSVRLDAVAFSNVLGGALTVGDTGSGTFTPSAVSAVPEASTSLGLLALGAGGLLTRRRLKRAA